MRRTVLQFGAAEQPVTVRNQSLDVLRGIAVLIVVFHHYASGFPSVLHIGIVGVDLFFVLSGFLISGLLFSELKNTGEISLKRFFLRRGLKIYPPFYAFLLITYPMTRRYGFPRLLCEALFLQSYKDGFWSHTWSLSVEELFYLVLPLVLLVLIRYRRLPAVPLIAVLLMIFCFVLRSGVERTQFSEAHLRFDALFAGVALSYIRHFHSGLFVRLSKARWTLPVGLLLLAPWLFGDHSEPCPSNLVLTVNILAFSAIVCWSQSLTIPAPIIARVGIYSYSIYLWHMPLSIFWGSTRTFSIIGFLFYVGVSVFVGIAAASIVEVPILQLRDRLWPSSVSQISGRHLERLPSKALPLAHI